MFTQWKSDSPHLITAARLILSDKHSQLEGQLEIRDMEYIT